jgi:hypothetical protein
LFIPDPDPDFLPIPDPGSRDQKGTGSPDPDSQHWFALSNKVPQSHFMRVRRQILGKPFSAYVLGTDWFFKINFIHSLEIVSEISSVNIFQDVFDEKYPTKRYRYFRYMEILTC